MKRLISIFLLLMMASCAVAENKAVICSYDQMKYKIGNDIPAGDYYLCPLNDIFSVSASISYSVYTDTETENRGGSRDYIQYPEILYPENADHCISLHEGETLLLFALSRDNGKFCDVMLIPKGEDATGRLSSLSYDELIARKNQINLAIWRSKEWQEVTVPQGTWEVGKDIPAGHWTVKCHPDTWATNISWGDHLSDNGEDISYWGRYSISNTVHNPQNETFDPINDISIYSFEVREGDYIKIIYGAAIFMPYIGTETTFGFK